MAKDITIKIDVEDDGSIKSVKSLSKNFNELAKNEKEATDAMDDFGKSTKKASDKVDKLDDTVKKTDESLKLTKKALKGLTLGNLEAEMTKLENKQASLNEELKGVAIGSKRFKELKKEIRGVEKEQDKLGKATSKSTKGISKGASLASEGFKALDGTLLGLATNPVVAVFAILALVIQQVMERLQNTTEGAAGLSAIFGKVSDALNPLLDALGKILMPVLEILVALLEGLTPLLNVIGVAFEWIGGLVQKFADFLNGLIDTFLEWGEALGLVEEGFNEQRKSVEAARKELVRLEAQSKKNAAQTAKDKAAIEELKLARDNELLTINERIKANEEIGKLSNEIAERDLKNLAAIVEQKQILLNNDKENLELQESLAEAEIELADKRGEVAGIAVEQATNRANLIKEELSLLADQRNGVIELAEAQEKSESKIFALKRASLTAQIALLKQRNATELTEYKALLQELKVLDAERLTELQNRSDEARKAIEDIDAGRIKNTEERNRKQLRIELDRFKEELEARGTLTQAEIELVKVREEETQRLINESLEREKTAREQALRDAESYSNQRVAIERKSGYQRELAELEVNDKLLAMQGVQNLDIINKQREGLEAELKLKKEYYAKEQALAKKTLDNELAQLDAAEEAKKANAQSPEERLAIEEEYNLKRTQLNTKYAETVEKNNEDIIKSEQAVLDKQEELFTEYVNLVQSKGDQLNNVFASLASGDILAFGQSIATFSDGLAAQFESLQTNFQELDLDGKLAAVAQIGATIAGAVGAAFSALAENSQEELDATLSKTQELYDADKEALDNSLASKEITQREYDSRLANIEKIKAQKELAAKRKAFKTDKKNNLAKAYISTAQAALSAFASAGNPILGAILAAIAVAFGAIQINAISKQKFTAARGGVVPGSGSGEVDKVDALLAPGEAVINARSSSLFAEELSAINQAGGGKSLTPNVSNSVINTNIYSNQSQEVKAVVVETDISDVQTRISRYETGSEL